MENLAATRRKKYHDNDDDDDDTGSGSDRISQLPESIQVHILCFLSQKKAAQTSVLSKSWRHLGPTRPLIDIRGSCDRNHTRKHKFCEDCYIGNNEEFLSALDKTFQRYHDRNLYLHELRLEMLSTDSRSISVLRKWIPVFIKPNSGVTTFDLSVESDDKTFLDLPSSVLKAESLENLCLYRCKISSIIQTVALQNLQKLYLSDVFIDDQTLGKIMSGCPFVEIVGLYDCNGLKTISIANGNQHLKKFKLSGVTKMGVIEIHTPTLQKIRIHVRSNWKLNHNNCFPHLKTLDLFKVQLPAELFEYFSCNFHLLEKLALSFCSGFEEIKLFCHSLKHLTIGLISSIKVDIDAPSITSFMFYGKIFPTTFSFTTTSREWKSQITLYTSAFPYDDVLLKFLKLNEMVKAVSQSKIYLDISKYMFHNTQPIECGIHDYPVVVENLEIHDIYSNFNPIPCLFYALFQICRPRNITTWYGSGSIRYFNGQLGGELLDYCIWLALVHEGENKEYYWQQHLEEVIVEAYDDRGVLRQVQGTNPITPPSSPKSSRKRKVEEKAKVVPRGFGPKSGLPPHKNPYHPIHSHRAIVPSAVVHRCFTTTQRLERKQAAHAVAYNEMLEAQAEQKEAFSDLHQMTHHLLSVEMERLVC